MKWTQSVLWVMVAASGCLNLELLDEMRIMDGGTGAPRGAQGGGDEDFVPEPDGEQGGGQDEIPPADPDDAEPPGLGVPECGGAERVDGGVCIAEAQISASLRFVTDEPAMVTPAVEGQGSVGTLSEQWSNRHHVVVTGLGVGSGTPVSLTLEDGGGNRAELQVTVAGQGGPAVAITEVLADPKGPEPGQEFVEIVNFGHGEVDLGGWMVDDNGDKNGSLIPEGTTLGPGEVGVVVSRSYDPGEGQDPAPDPSAIMIVLASSVGSNGLKNSDAETVELYDKDGLLVSQYTGQAGKPKEGLAAVRIVAELPDGDLLAFGPDPLGGSTPGRTDFLSDFIETKTKNDM